MRELDQRNSSGEIVTLWWNETTDVVSLTVHRVMSDGSDLVTADIPNVPRDCCRDAFEHPYSYAHHGGSVTLPEREPERCQECGDGPYCVCEYNELDGSDEHADGEYADPNDESEV